MNDVAIQEHNNACPLRTGGTMNQDRLRLGIAHQSQCLHVIVRVAGTVAVEVESVTLSAELFGELLFSQVFG